MTFKLIQQDSFDSFLEDNSIVVLCFGAHWCAPCHDFEKVCAEVAKDLPEVSFAKIDVEKSPQLVADFNVRSIPFVMIMRKRTVLYAESGLLSREDLLKMLQLTTAMKGEGKVAD